MYFVSLERKSNLQSLTFLVVVVVVSGPVIVPPVIRPAGPGDYYFFSILLSFSVIVAISPNYFSVHDNPCSRLCHQCYLSTFLVSWKSAGIT